MNYSFLGKGLSFPINTNDLGQLQTSNIDQNIQESIKIILSTKLGERMMRPNFGCRIHELLFSLNTVDTHNLIIYYIIEALEKWESRIVLKDVRVVKKSLSSIDVDINYQIKENNSIENLVYPFYLNT